MVGIQKLAALNSNLATRHILFGKKYIIKGTAEGVSYRIGDLLKYSDLKEDFARKIGATAVMDLEAIKNLHLFDFGIFIDLYLDIEEKAKLEADLSVEIANGTLSFADKYKILSIPNFKYAVNYASILREKRMKEIQKAKMEEIQAQGQANAQSAQLAEGARQQTAQIVGQIEMGKQQLLNEGLIQKEKVKGLEERQTLETKFLGEFQIAQVEAGVQGDKIKFIEDKKDERLVKQATMTSKENSKKQKENAEPIDFEREEVNDEIFELED